MQHAHTSASPLADGVDKWTTVIHGLSPVTDLDHHTHAHRIDSHSLVKKEVEMPDIMPGMA